MSQEDKIILQEFSFFYDALPALQKINLTIQTNEIFAIFGPARSGKTTLLKSLNRLTDLIFGTHHTGTILLDGIDIYDPRFNLTRLRRRVGMVFDLPTPLPLSIFDNVAYGPQTGRNQAEESIERNCREGPSIRRALGGSQGPSSHLRPGTLRRTAAAPLHCPSPGPRTRSPSSRRTLFGTGPDFNRQHRRISARI